MDDWTKGYKTGRIDGLFRAVGLIEQCIEETRKKAAAEEQQQEEDDAVNREANNPRVEP